MNLSVISLGSRRAMARAGAKSEVGMGTVFPIFLAILMTLFAVVYFKDLNRRLFLQEQSSIQQVHMEKVKQWQKKLII